MAESARDAGSVRDLGDHSVSWSNLSNALTYDSNYADAAFSTIFGHGWGTVCNTMEYYNFGFSIPTGSTITGAYAVVYGYQAPYGTFALYDAYIGSVTGTRTNDWIPTVPLSMWAYSYTGSGLSISEVNSSSFGFGWTFYWYKGSETYNVAYATYGGLTIYYTEPYSYGHKPYSISATSVGKIMGVNASNVSKFLGQ